MRWGTLSLGDLAVATRVAGPTLVAGPGAVRAGMALAAAAAIVGEAQAGGFRSRGWGGRAADALVASTLAPLFVVGGPADEVVTDAVVWAAATVAATAVILLLGRRPTGFVPRWVPAVAAAAGVAASIGAS